MRFIESGKSFSERQWKKTVLGAVAGTAIIGGAALESSCVKAAPAPSSTPRIEASRRPVKAAQELMYPSEYGTAPFEAGVAVSVYGNADNFQEYYSETIDRVKEMNANTIRILVPIFMKNSESTDVYTDPNQTPTDENVDLVIKKAHDDGLAVVLEPFFDEGNFQAESTLNWKGNIKPTDVPKWFESYSSIINHYAQIAEKNGAEQLCIGAELNSMEQYTSQWLDLIKAVRSEYQGRVVYAQNYDMWDVPDFTSSLDGFGIDAYYALQYDSNGNPLPSTGASEQQMEEGWQYHLNDIANKEREAAPLPVVFAEFGVTSQKGAYEVPYMWNYNNEPPDEAEQARFIDATCNVLVKTKFINGITWSRVYKPTDLSYKPQTDITDNTWDKAGQTELANCFSAAEK